MTLRRKTLTVTILTLVGLLGLFYLASQLILSRSFQQLEERYAIQNVQRALHAIQNDLNAFKGNALGWSKWDDVYNFITDKNQNFIDNNFTDTTFVDSDLDLMIFVNNENQIVFSKAFDNDAGEVVPVSDALLHLIQPDNLLVRHSALSSEYAGLIKLPDGYLMTLSLPVLTSLGEGPVNGTLIWGRYLNETRIKHLSDAIDLSVTLIAYDDPKLPQNVRTAEQELTADQSYFTIPVSTTFIAGYTIINDLYGNPIALMRVELPRTIYAQGQQTIAYFLLAVLLISLTYSMVNIAHLDRNVLHWLSLLSTSITQIRTTGNLKLPINIPGNDELATLAVGLQSMLDALDVSRRQLQTVNAELEQRVQARTTDLTKAIELLQLEVSERQRAQEQALEASRFKSQILANVSHDSRTPLSTIMLYTESMRNGYYGPLTEKQGSRLEGIMTSAQQLLSFINNLLDEAQLNSGTMKLKQVQLVPQQLLHEVSMVLIPQAEHKDLPLIVEADPNMPSSIMGDSERLKQVILNLVDNAIKFTDRGSIAVKLAKQSDSQYSLSISDTGSGIPDDAQSRIFDAFWQVNGTQHTRGVGLGLSIVKQIINMMDGTIVVDSKLGKGTTFTINLPLIIPVSENVEDAAQAVR